MAMRHLPRLANVTAMRGDGSFGIHLFTATENNAIANDADDRILSWGVPKMFYCDASRHTKFE